LVPSLALKHSEGTIDVSTMKLNVADIAAKVTSDELYEPALNELKAKCVSAPKQPLPESAKKDEAPKEGAKPEDKKDGKKEEKKEPVTA
jgi:hypothetical protein